MRRLSVHSVMQWRNSLSQTRGTSTNWTPLFRVELTFKGHEDAMIFCVSIFIFCLEQTVREQLDENDFRRYYGIFFKVPFRKYLINYTTTLKVLSQQLQDTLTVAFRTIHFSWKFYGHGSPYELIFSWVNIFKWKSTRYREKHHLHNNPSLLFEEHCTKMFHLLL